MLTVTRRFKFDAAHYLPDYLGPCGRLHGHTWYVDVEVEGTRDPETGLLIDFRDLKEAAKTTIDLFDHNNLNDLITEPPTAENLAVLIAERLVGRIPGNGRIKSVTVWESPDCCAKYEIQA
jgi:6-pyruvoyltetrahydropterin/6-carboxytetrahydropterin synthase